MKNKRICFFIFQIFTICKLFAQSPQCDNGVPFFNVNLSGNNDSLWISASTVRSGLCCGLDPLAKPPIRCVQFAITLDSNTAGIKFTIPKGALPPGALGYSIDCGNMYQVGEEICLDPPWPRYLTFCKPGNNPNVYSIQAIPKPKVTPPIVVSDGCTGILSAEGFITSTIKWEAIPNNPLYDSYLNCTLACTTVTATWKDGAPEYVDYQVSGMPIGGCSSMIVTKTTRVYFVNDKKATITPIDPTVCFGQSTTTLTANGTGGKPPYKYLWSNGDTTQSIMAGVGKYSVKIFDASSCPEAVDSITVTQNSLPIDVNAGNDQAFCKNTLPSTINLVATLQQAKGIKWSGGSGNFSPNDSSLSVSYIPTQTEINQGKITLKLKSTGNGLCEVDSDFVDIKFLNIPVANHTGNSICLGSSSTQTTTLQNGESAKWLDANNAVLSTTNTVTINPSASTFYSLQITNADNCISSDTFEIKVLTPSVLVQADTLICEGSNVTITPKITTLGSDNLLYEWTKNGVLTANTSAIVSNTGANTYSLTYGNLCKNTIKFAVTTYPISVDAGNNASLCVNASNKTINLLGSNSNSTSIQWIGGNGVFSEPNNVATSYTLDNSELTPGDSIKLYMLSSGNIGCNVAKDSLWVKVLQNPFANIYNRLVCLNSTIKLKPQNVFNVNKYQWSIDGIITSTDSILSFDVNKSSYNIKLIILSKDLCENQSEIEVNSFNKPDINTPDTSLCFGTDYKLATEINNNTIQDGNYYWYKDNILLDTSSSITISESGIYVIKYGKEECIGVDTAEVVFTKKDVLGKQELPFCLKDKTVNLNLKNYFNYPVKWKGGSGTFSPSDTNQNVTYTFASNENQEMVRILFVVESLNPTITCSSKTDSIWVSPLPIPEVIIVQDTVCEGLNTKLNAISSSNNLYEWTFLGQKSYEKNISTKAINGNLIKLNIQDSITGCRNDINYTLFSVKPPLIKINFPSPCKGSTSILKTDINQSNYLNGLGKFVWYKNNEIIKNENKSSLETKNDSWYKVIFNIGECIAKDSAFVEFKDAPNLNLNDKVEFCKETDLYITLDGGSGYAKYVWEYDDNQTNPKIIVNENKYYSLTVYNEYNCSTTDSILVVDVCPPRLFVPTAFTPGQNNNNNFLAMGKYFTNYRMIIFNRWGEIIFESTNPNNQWDGSYRGEEMPIGVYPWIVTYEGLVEKFKGPYMQKGSVTLIR